MGLPLYKREAGAPPRLGAHGHAGLWYDKFCDAWGAGWTLKATTEGSQPKLEWMKTVTERPVGERTLLEEAVDRHVRLVRASGGFHGFFVSQGRFVTGLGRSHPVENGFAWHPTLGTPYLPGSSIKGMVRAWAREEDDEALEKLLGTKEQTGAVCFLDAIPSEPVRLEVDVLTPHYASWEPSSPPGDWSSPVPVPFLTTAGGSVFLFAAVPMPGHEKSMEAVERAMRETLETLGGGAKTAVGYGRFRPDAERQRRWTERLQRQEEERAAEARREELMRTPEGRWRLKLEGMKEMDVLDMVRIHLEKEPLADPAERKALARAVEALGWPARWMKGQTQVKNLGIPKLKARARLVRQAAAEE